MDTGTEPTESGIWSWIPYARGKIPDLSIVTVYRPQKKKPMENSAVYWQHKTFIIPIR